MYDHENPATPDGKVAAMTDVANGMTIPDAARKHGMAEGYLGDSVRSIRELLESDEIQYIRPAGRCEAAGNNMMRPPTPEEQVYLDGMAAAQSLIDDGKPPRWWEGFRLRLRQEFEREP